VQAFGTDRVQTDAEGRILLSCRLPKAVWQPRVEKSLTRSEHPGTAVLWDDKYYEVVDLQPLQGNAVRYVLEPWRDQHVMRTTDRYDEQSEALRLSEYKAGLSREKRRKSANFLSIFTGHLPARIQEHLASDLGVNAPRLTLMSTIPPILAFCVCLHFAVGAAIAHRPSPVRAWVWILVGYLTFESVIRISVAWNQNRPMGSVAGLLAYSMYYAVARDGKMISPFKPADGSGTNFTPATEDVSLRDAFIVREPLVTLLSEREQVRLLERFDYDYRTYSRKVAVTIAVLSTLGAMTSLYSLLTYQRIGSLISLVVAFGLVLEQFRRMRAFEQGPAGSVLAPLIRPFVRKLFLKTQGERRKAKVEA
jgi:hypothetical protein